MASGTRRQVVTVPIAGVTENVLAGTPLQYPGVASAVEVYATCVAAAAGEITMDVIFGTDVVAEALAVPIETTAGHGVVIPDHKMCADACAASDQVQIRLRNAAAAATRDVTVVVVVQPV
jgi:hypothetical protein